MAYLGQYAGPVLWSYAVSLVLILGLVAVSIRRSRRAKAELEAIEKRDKRDG